MREIQIRYTLNPHRRRLFAGLQRAVQSLRFAGCSILYLNGSFITAKEHPDDYDACWEARGVKLADLDPVLLDFSSRRAAQKSKYFGEFFPAHAAAAGTPLRTFLTFFQTDKNSGAEKGIIGIDVAKTA